MVDSNEPDFPSELDHELLSDVTALCHEIHTNPELGWAEHATQRRIKEWLEERGLIAHTVAETGLYVDVGEGQPRVVYRGDIDALPIHEGTSDGRACVSATPGVSHACGHDMHASIAAGLAVLMHRRRETLGGALRFVFQPAEEVLPSGAKAVVDAGLLDGIKGALALHCDPARDVGTVGLRCGPLTATSDGVSIHVRGKGGHAARPHLAADALQAAAHIVQSLSVEMARGHDPLESRVLSLCRIQGGHATNVIADHVHMEGTLRTFSENSRTAAQASIEQVAMGVAQVHGCTAEVAFEQGAPTVFNDAGLHELVVRAARKALGDTAVQNVDRPSTGAEDFGYFSQAIPTYMMRLGVRTVGAPTHHLHTPDFHADEQAIPVALHVMAQALVYAMEA